MGTTTSVLRSYTAERVHASDLPMCMHLFPRYDLLRSYTAERVHFSMSHAIFFAACLYRVSFRAAAFSTGTLTLTLTLARSLPDRPGPVPVSCGA